MIVNDVTDVREDHVFEYALLQIFQEPVESNTKRFSVQVINHVLDPRVTLFLRRFPPLADLFDLQDVGEERFLVHDDQRFLQFSAVLKVFSQDSQGSKVRSLGRQNLKHTL